MPFLFDDRNWGMGFRPQIVKQVPQSPVTGQFFKMTAFCIAFYESYLSTQKSNTNSQNHTKLVRLI
jgi:hypothetical protein